jgi:hypothetical protein
VTAAVYIEVNEGKKWPLRGKGFFKEILTFYSALFFFSLSVACPAAARLPDTNKLIRGLPGCRLPKRNGLFMAENFVLWLHPHSFRLSD